VQINDSEQDLCSVSCKTHDNIIRYQNRLPYQTFGPVISTYWNVMCFGLNVQRRENTADSLTINITNFTAVCTAAVRHLRVKYCP